MDKVRYGMIGFGGIAENRLAKEGFACDKSRFAPLEEAVLIGATDITPARRAAVENLGLKWYGNAAAMLADPEIEAVVIATNNRTHHGLAVQAMEAGRHVIVEKPLATNSELAADLVARAAKAGLNLAVDHMMVNNCLNRKARQIVASGVLGKIEDSSFHMQFPYGYEPAEAASWRCSCIDEMGGPVGDVASHCFYVMEFVLGRKIQAVHASYYPKLMSIRAEDGAVIRCELDDGTPASVFVSFCERRGGAAGAFGGLGYEVYGERGAIRGYGTMFQLSGYADEPYPIHLDLDFGDRIETFRPENPSNIYQGVVRAHAKAIRSGVRLTGEDGLHNVELCEQTHASARLNCK